jgi:signal transduction histidine kinase
LRGYSYHTEQTYVDWITCTCALVPAQVQANATSSYTKNATITIRLREVEGEVQVDVVDNGCAFGNHNGVGIAPEDQDRIFERFFRGENPLVLATPGTGLGLPIVKQLVNMHKGQIWMTSSGVAGEGSTFSFTLPLYQAKE